MKSVFGPLGILYAVILVADGRYYVRDKILRSDGGVDMSLLMRLNEVYGRYKDVSGELDQIWKAGSQFVDHSIEDIKKSVTKTNELLGDPSIDMEDLTTLLSVEECHTLGTLFMLQHLLPNDPGLSAKIFSIPDCINQVNVIDLGFKEAKQKILTQITDCDLKAFDAIKQFIGNTESTDARSIVQIGNLINQLTEAVKLTIGITYLDNKEFVSTEKIVEAGNDNFFYAMGKMEDAGFCQGEPEHPARKRSLQARTWNLFTK